MKPSWLKENLEGYPVKNLPDLTSRKLRMKPSRFSCFQPGRFKMPVRPDETFQVKRKPGRLSGKKPSRPDKSKDPAKRNLASPFENKKT
jgi:hypothetical protein